MWQGMCRADGNTIEMRCKEHAQHLIKGHCVNFKVTKVLAKKTDTWIK
jgi:hypothetical protein